MNAYWKMKNTICLQKNLLIGSMEGMAYKIIVSPRAQKEIENAGDYYETTILKALLHERTKKL